MTKGDKASVGMTYAILAILSAFPFLVIYFVVYKSGGLHRNAHTEISFRYSKHLKRVNEQKLQISEGETSSIAKQKEMTKLRLSNISYRNHAHYRKLKDQERNDYGFYEVFYSGLSLYKPYSRFYQLIFVTHRLLFVVSIFAWGNFVWLQVSFFMVACLLKGGYMLQIRPFERKSDNRLEVMNEFFQLIIGYIFLCLITMVLAPAEIVVVGNILIITVSVMIGCNSLLLLYGFFLAVKLRIRMFIRAKRCHKEVKASKLINEKKWANRHKSWMARRVDSSDEDSSSVILTTEKAEENSQKDDATTPEIAFEPIEERKSLSEISSQNSDDKKFALIDPFTTPQRNIELCDAHSCGYSSPSQKFSKGSEMQIGSSFESESNSNSESESVSGSKSSLNHSEILPNSGDIDLCIPKVTFGMSYENIPLKSCPKMSPRIRPSNSLDTMMHIKVKDGKSANYQNILDQGEEEKNAVGGHTDKIRDHSSNLDFNIGANLSLLKENLTKTYKSRMPITELASISDRNESIKTVSERSMAQRKQFDYDTSGSHATRQSKYTPQESQAQEITLVTPFESIREVTKTARSGSDERPESLLTVRMRLPLSSRGAQPSHMSKQEQSSSNQQSSYLRQGPAIVIDPHVPIRKLSKSVVGKPSETDLLKFMKNSQDSMDGSFTSRSHVQQVQLTGKTRKSNLFTGIYSPNLDRRRQTEQLPNSLVGGSDERAKGGGSVRSAGVFIVAQSLSSRGHSVSSRQTLSNAGDFIIRSPARDSSSGNNKA